MFASGLFVLNCGSIFSDKGNVLTYRVDVGKKVEITVSPYLIRSEKESLLFNTGIDHDDCAYINENIEREIIPGLFGTHFRLCIH